MKWFTPPLAFVTALFGIEYGLSYREPIARAGTITAEGESYAYFLETPRSSTRRTPLIVALHGYGGSPLSMRSASELHKLLDDGYAVLWMQGRRDDAGQSAWNADLSSAARNDIDALIETLQLFQNDYGFDPDRTAIVGYSNGGFMAYSFACATERLAVAIVVVNGTMSGATYETCPTPQDEALLHIHGADDEVVPPDGSMPLDGGWGGAPDITTVIAKYAGRENPRRLPNGRPVRAVLLRGEGHDWPQIRATRGRIRAFLSEVFETPPTPGS